MQPGCGLPGNKLPDRTQKCRRTVHIPEIRALWLLQPCYNAPGCRWLCYGPCALAVTVHSTEYSQSNDSGDRGGWAPTRSSTRRSSFAQTERQIHFYALLLDSIAQIDA